MAEPPPDPDPEVLTWSFPMPNSPELVIAYHNLYLAGNGSDEDKKRLGPPVRLPRPWDPPTCTTRNLRTELWLWLEQVASWINHEYVWNPGASMIPTCWPQHPHLVHEIAVLADQRRRAAIDPTSSSMEEWHRYCLPAFFDRMKARMAAGCDEHHTHWPAQPRYRRHTDGRADRIAAYKADVLGMPPPTAPPPPNPTQPPLDQDGPAPPDDQAERDRPSGLRLITDNGERINPHTGEVL